MSSSLSFLALLAVATFLGVPGRIALAAEPINQTTAQTEAEKLNRQASDDSLKGTYTNGMGALKNLYDLNIPGAIQKGLKAYGQYRNSEKLDTMKEKNEELQAKMASAGTGSGVSASKKKEGYVSPFARLPDKFLYEGDAGKIAAEVERISGVSRKDFFHAAVAIHQTSKSLTDPGFIAWGKATYEKLLPLARNSEVKEKMEQVYGLGMKMLENGQAETIMAEFGKVDKGKVTADAPAKEGKGTGTTVAVAPSAPATDAKSEVSVPSAAAPMAEVSAPAPSVAGPPKSQTSSGGIHQLETQEAFLGGLVNSAIVQNKAELNLTIFQQVSRKIREQNQKQQLGR